MEARDGTHGDEEGDVGGCYGRRKMVACDVAPTWFVIGRRWQDSRWCCGSRCLKNKNILVVVTMIWSLVTTAIWSLVAQ